MATVYFSTSAVRFSHDPARACCLRAHNNKLQMAAPSSKHIRFSICRYSRGNHDIV